MRARLRISLLTGVIAMVGCSERSDPTAVQITLVAEPSKNTAAQLLAVIDRVELILDAREGFSNMPASAGVVGTMRAEDLDADDDLELILSEDIERSDALPVIRLRPGSNLQRTFRIRARGLVGDTVTAIGQVATVSFEPGDSVEVEVPFNLRAAYLPPRILWTYPSDGQPDVENTFAPVVGFSKLIDHDTIAGNLTLQLETSSEPVQIRGSWQLSDSVVEVHGLPEPQTTARFVRDDNCTLPGGTIGIIATSAITDEEDTPLEVPEEADSFGSSFEVPGLPVVKCPSAGLRCESDDDCLICKPGADCVPPDPALRAVCDTDPKSPTHGSCVLVVTDCGQDFRCPDGYVCDVVQALEGAPDAVTCVPDCREQDTCALSTVCEESTGRCK